MAELGSLSQGARKKQLNSARNTLIVVGILTLLVNIFLFFNAENEIDRAIDGEIKKAGPGAVIDQVQLKQAKEKILTGVRILYGGTAGLGLVFIVLGCLVYVAPVPIVITGLVLYIAANAIYGFLNPATLVQGLLFKIIIILLLARAVQAAFAYQKEKAEEREEEEKEADDLEVIS